MATTVWLARHGEVHNPAGLLYGRLPRMGLSPTGRQQAQALAAFLAARPLTAIYSSPMLRARRTAEAMLAQHPALPRVRIDADLQEIHTSWQGQPLTALEQIGWDFYANPRDPADETLHMIAERMHRWLRRVLRRHAGGEVVGVSHGDPVLILVGTLRGLPLDPARLFPRPYIEPATVFELCFDDQGAFRSASITVPHARAAA